MTAAGSRHAARREPRAFLARLRRKPAPAPAPVLAHDLKVGGTWTGASGAGIPDGTPGVLRTGPFPAVTPGGLLSGGDFRRPLIVPAGLLPETGDAPQDRQRPYAPGGSGPPPPGAPTAWLRAVPRDGQGGRTLETLTGLPFFAGLRHDLAAGRVAGVCLGIADDIWLVLDAQSAAVIDALEAALREARDQLAYGSFRDAMPAGSEVTAGEQDSGAEGAPETAGGGVAA